MKNNLGHSLNIYIFGNKDFKKEIKSLIKRSNLKLRMDDDDIICEPSSLAELQDAIIDNPEDIFLIDDSKIIKENALNQKIKFLIPKDAIAKSFLEEHGIGDMKVDSMSDLSKYLLSKFEDSDETSYNENEKDFDIDERNEIQESIISIVDDAYSEDELKENNISKTVKASESGSTLEEDLSPELDDELTHLLSKIQVSKENESLEAESFEEEKSILDDIDSIDEDKEKQDETNLDELLKSLGEAEEEEEDLSPDLNELLNSLEEGNEEKKRVIDDIGELMNNSSSLDELNEKDILAALNGEDISSNENIQNVKEDLNQRLSSEDKLSINLDNADDLSKVLAQLLNNKTLEITVKVKE